MITYMKSTSKTSSKDKVWKSIRQNWGEEANAFAENLDLAFITAEYKKKLAVAVKSRRQELGLSQRSLANLIGISQREVCHLEAAKSNPTLSTQLKICSVLGLSLEIKAN